MKRTCETDRQGRPELGTRIGGAALAVVLALGPWVDHDATAARPGVKRPPVQGTFTDRFDSLDTTRWSRADGWKNGSPFDNAWRADRVAILDGRLDRMLDDAATLGEPYASGELRSNGCFGYGCYEASFKPVLAPGAVTSLFTFAGSYDNGGSGQHTEIDVEFLGNQPGRVQLNFWTNDDSYVSRNEVLIDLGFDPGRLLRDGPGDRARAGPPRHAGHRTSQRRGWARTAGGRSGGRRPLVRNHRQRRYRTEHRCVGRGNSLLCVTGVTGGGLEYDAGANLETCDEISKWRAARVPIRRSHKPGAFALVAP